MSRRLLGRALRNPTVNRAAVGLLKTVGQTRLAKKARRIGKPVPDVVSFDVPSGNGLKTLRMHSQGGRDQVVLTIYIKGWAHYEKPLPEVYCKLAAACRVVFDVGANTGYYSLLACASPLVEKIYAFEPVPEIVEFLNRNIRENRLGERIVSLPLALGETAATATLFIPTQEHGLVETSASLNPGFKTRHSGSFEVQVVTVDDFVAEQRLDALDLLKIDVESVEHTVLAGAAKAIGDFRPYVTLEVLESSNLQALEAFASTREYAIVALEGRPRVVSHVAPQRHSRDYVFCPREKMETFQTLIRGL